VKLDGLDHPKTLDLAARLDISLPQAIGHLELLWAFVAQKTPHGNVGKWADGAIARAAHWTGEPTVFVTAMVEAGFIDLHNKYRLVVHDWHEHAPRWVASKLSRANESFCSLEQEAAPVTEKSDSTSEDTQDCSADCSQDSGADSKPSLVKPSQDEEQDTPPAAADDDQSVPASVSVWDIWVQVDKSANPRPFLGKQIKTYGETAVRRAVLETLNSQPADPKAYLVKILGGSNANTGKPDANGNRRLSTVERVRQAIRQQPGGGQTIDGQVVGTDG